MSRRRTPQPPSRAARSSVMHKLHFSRGIVAQREYWRSNTLPSIRQVRLGCFARLRIYEENARFVLLAALLLGYLALGALLFGRLERRRELDDKLDYRRRLAAFEAAVCDAAPEPATCRLLLGQLLDQRGNLSAHGLTYAAERWDFGGSFYFAATVISTIGFGMTTPRTPAGRALLICYGFFGCAGCILFFNLFLERIVTAFALALRALHDCKLRRRRLAEASHAAVTLVVPANDADDLSSVGGVARWKPSVYKVFLCLFALTAVLLAAAAAVYSRVESWSYLDALYCCFVSFGTIGFGDLVPNQQRRPNAQLRRAYAVVNFAFISLGCCCVYSLFNVFTVIIRQLLNRIIRWLDVDTRRLPCCQPKKPQRYLGLGLRPPAVRADDDGSDGDELNRSDGLVSLKEFLGQNKAQMVSLQQHLFASSFKNVHSSLDEEDNKVSVTSIGPLAILTEKFGED